MASVDRDAGRDRRSRRAPGCRDAFLVAIGVMAALLAVAP